ncbi:MAG: 4-hydroxy-tetrahydrodipicolinate reductase [Bacteroidaceae bacterium]|nr:4-hydroxy-tetrahydrodipicolinate reductase [Bacteroidaceae bacterium]
MKIALIGYGKMGKTIEQIAIARGHEIVARIDIDNQDDFNSPEFKSADVAIEFSQPQSAMNNYRRAFAAGVKVVSGTTGWLDNMPEVKEACENGSTFFHSSNFSLGVNIFFAINKYLAKIMNGFTNYEVSMEETHHIHKLDAPSGTAITLAEGIIENITRKDAWVEGAEPKSTEIGITSIRRDEVPGIHTIKYESEVDTITITHDAKSRAGFALGAVVAAEFIKDKTGFITMQDMLKF